MDKPAGDEELQMDAAVSEGDVETAAEHQDIPLSDMENVGVEAKLKRLFGRSHKFIFLTLLFGILFLNMVILLMDRFDETSYIPAPPAKDQPHAIHSSTADHYNSVNSDAEKRALDASLVEAKRQQEQRAAAAFDAVQPGGLAPGPRGALLIKNRVRALKWRERFRRLRYFIYMALAAFILISYYGMSHSFIDSTLWSSAVAYVNSISVEDVQIQLSNVGRLLLDKLVLLYESIVQFDYASAYSRIRESISNIDYRSYISRFSRSPAELRHRFPF